MLVMKPYLEMTTEELTQELDTLRKEYNAAEHEPGYSLH